MNRPVAGLVLLGLLGGLAACSSAPADPSAPSANFDPAKDPYWQDARWEKTLADALQAAVHDPVASTDTSTPGLHTTVKFTFADGIIEYPEIVTGTGDPELDKLVLRQIESAQLPKAVGIDADKPHEFELELAVPTPVEAVLYDLERFQYAVDTTIDAQKVYPKDALFGRVTGDVVVDFDYMDGKASGIATTTSSKSKDLDKSSITAVTRAVMPPAPAAYAGKPLHMQVLFCYTMTVNGALKNKCPAAKNMIVVSGALFRR
jgi:hypothetical protein